MKQYYHICIRGDVKINWLQPPYSAAITANLYRKCYTFLLNAAAFWLQPAVMNFDVFPKFKRLTKSNIVIDGVSPFKGHTTNLKVK